jgi:hypothetical protein
MSYPAMNYTEDAKQQQLNCCFPSVIQIQVMVMLRG